jgi:hypothetical protein
MDLVYEMVELALEFNLQGCEHFVSASYSQED